MSRFWSPIVSRLTPYVAGEQPTMAGVVKLNTNENPYPPSPRALESIRQATGAGLRLYPDPHAQDLKDALALRHGLQANQVFVGNGSDEVLAHAFHAFFQQELPILMPEVSYAFYNVYCKLYGIRCRKVPMGEQLQIDLESYGAPNGGVVLANPNAPTGRGIATEVIDALLRRHRDSVVLVDEAYVDFGARSAVPLIHAHDNLLVVQTFSKSRSLAGMRIGFALGCRDLVEALERVKNSFNSYPLSRLACAAAIASLQDEDHFEATTSAIAASREQLARDLVALRFEVLPSQANFVFARHPSHDGGALYQGLKAQGVLVRHFDTPPIEQYLRITVGTPEQCARLVHVLGALLSGYTAGVVAR